MKSVKGKIISMLALIALMIGMMPQLAMQAYADEKTGTELPYYGADPTAYTPETITVDRTLVIPKSFILYPGETLKFTQDAEGASPRYMGFSSTTELSAGYGFTDGTTYLVGEVNATGEDLYIYDKIVLAEDADYALYIYFNGNGGAGLKDDPDTDVNEAQYGAYSVSMIEKVPLYINLWYQLYNGSIPSGAPANPTKILNPKEPTFLKLNSAPARTGEVLDYWGGTPDYVPAGEDYPAGAVSVWPVYPINSSEQYFYSGYQYSGNYANDVKLGLVANYKPITYKIKIGDVSAYETLYGSKGFLQWYDPISTYTTDYIKSQINSASSWKVVGTDTRSNLDIEGTVTASEYAADYNYYGIRAQAPADGYILSGWSITDSTGNEIGDKYRLYMTETHAAKAQDGTWNYLLCIAVHDDYYDLSLPYDKTFVVTPIFVEAREEISQVNVSMDLSDYVGGDDYNAQEERATIVAADVGKYSITKEQTTVHVGVTGYVSGDYIVEPGDVLCYTAAFEANRAEGYQFASTVDLVVNCEKVASATTDGSSVRFQDEIQQMATGGVTAVTFNEVAPGDSSWSASATFTGISRSKANLEAGKETEYGMEGQPTTIVSFEFKINGGATRYIDFEPALCSGTETFSSTSPASMNFQPWNYTFQEGDEVSWKCYAYNFRNDSRMGWVPYEVGETIEGSFTVETPENVTVSFDTDGLYETPATQTIAYGAKASRPATPEKDAHANNYETSGLSFRGWYTKPVNEISSYWEFCYTPASNQAGCIFDFDTSITKNTTAYAVYEGVLTIKTYDVTNGRLDAGGKFDHSNYNSLSGSNDKPSGYQTTAFYNMPAFLTAKPAEGYKFAGWSTSTSKDDIISTEAEYEYIFKQRATLYALFEKAREVYLCVGSSEGGSYELTKPVGKENYDWASNHTVYEQNNITLKAIPESGYGFMGWYKGVREMDSSKPGYGFVTGYDPDKLITKAATYAFDITEDTEIYALFEKTQHTHNWNIPTYTWSADNKKVTAARVCKDDASHKETETVNTTSKVATAATCTAKGKTTYTATFKNSAFRTQTRTVEDIAAKGHKYGAWTKLNNTQHQRVCANDKTHVEKADHSWDAGKVTKAATYTATGVKTYTCKICKATKTEIIPKVKEAPLVKPTGQVIILNTIANSAKKTNDVIWDKSKVRGATNYEINWRAKGASKWASRTVGNTVRGVTSGLTIGQMYEIRVRPVNTRNGKSAYGAWSPTVYRYFHTTQKIRLKSASKGSFTMSWAKNSAATSYQVMFTTNSNGAGAAKNIHTVGASATSFTKTGLRSGVTYYVQVREIRKIGNINYIGNISCPVAVKVN